MGIQFEAYDEGAVNELPCPTSAGMSYGTAQRLLGLLDLPVASDLYEGGQCALSELRTGLERYPDGHGDPLIGQRMGELLRLLIEAERIGPHLVITWA